MDASVRFNAMKSRKGRPKESFVINTGGHWAGFMVESMSINEMTKETNGMDRMNGIVILDSIYKTCIDYENEKFEIVDKAYAYSDWIGNFSELFNCHS